MMQQEICNFFGITLLVNKSRFFKKGIQTCSLE